MLCELNVDNLALIESLQLSFEQAERGALVVMTGETGAGKSIMLRAISLLTGRRASTDWIRAGSPSCTVEALFEIEARHQTVHGLLEEGGFSDGNSLVIKRILSDNGRSRFYLNGSLATARAVSDICLQLLNIASQHDHQQLLQPALHLDFLDTIGDLWPRREQYQEVYQQWRRAREQLAELRSRDRDREQRLDFLSFQVSEIAAAAPIVGEDEELARERQRLKSADALIRISRECYSLMSTTITDELAQLRKSMEQLAELDPEVAELAEDLGSYSYLAEDYSARLRGYCDSLENDPIRLEAVTERLDQLQSLKRKYGETIEEVLEFAEKAGRELRDIEDLDREIETQLQRTAELEAELLKLAGGLSAERRKTARSMEASMSGELHSLAMPQARIEVRFQNQGTEQPEPEALRASGCDRVEFFFAPNPGEPPRPLVKVASGGELSRLMLALKCLLARKDMVETVIFDEVDAGIGGEAAEAVARKIQELSAHHQVFCITHLPQIAARGTCHYRVEKEVCDGRTQTRVTMLDEDGRVAELARMLAGESATGQARAWARELLDKGRKAA